MERTKLDLEINAPKPFELLFDQCIIGQNRWGDYFLYALSDLENGEEFSFFAPQDAHEQLKQYCKGDQVILTKTAEQKGKKVVLRHNVTPYKNGSAVDEAVSNLPAAVQARSTNGNGNGNGAAPQNGNGAAPHNGNGNGSGAHIYDERLYFKNMLESFEDAVKLQKQYQGVDLNRIAITLFISRSRTNGYPSYPA